MDIVTIYWFTYVHYIWPDKHTDTKPQKRGLYCQVGHSDKLRKGTPLMPSVSHKTFYTTNISRLTWYVLCLKDVFKDGDITSFSKRILWTFSTTVFVTFKCFLSLGWDQILVSDTSRNFILTNRHEKCLKYILRIDQMFPLIIHV